MEDFEDRVAVITGAASGIGRGFAEHCAAEGMKIVLADIEEAPLAMTQSDIAAMGADVIAVQTEKGESFMLHRVVLRYSGILVSCLVLGGCATTNLLPYPPLPPPSSTRTQSGFLLFADMVSIYGLANQFDARRAEEILLRYINNARYFKETHGSWERKPEEGRFLSLKATISPKEEHKFNWLVTWPAIWPMPFYWPVQVKNGSVSVALRCEFYDDLGEHITTLSSEKSAKYSIPIYGFFKTKKAEDELRRCYESAFEEMASKISSQHDLFARALETKSDKDTSPPRISLLEPAISRGMKKKTSLELVSIRGQVLDDSEIREVLVNGRSVNHGRMDGIFRAQIPLDWGTNEIRIRATDVRGNTVEEIYRLIREEEVGPSLAVGKYFALVVGIDQYSGKWMPLQNAVNDARAVAGILDSLYQFNEIITLYDQQATREQIIQQLEWLVNNVKEEDNVLIFFSGHGYLEKRLNRGFWIPADATTLSTAGYLSNSVLQDFLSGISSKHTLLVSDACFSGDIFRGYTETIPFQDSERYYREVYQRMSRQAITSGGIEPVTDGGRDGHSVFTYYFLKALKNNQSEYLDASQLFDRLKIPVTNNSDQTPIFQPIKNTGDEGGHFLFIRER